MYVFTAIYASIVDVGNSEIRIVPFPKLYLSCEDNWHKEG